MLFYFDPKRDDIDIPTLKDLMQAITTELTKEDTPKKERVVINYSDSLKELNEVRNQKVERK